MHWKVCQGSSMAAHTCPSTARAPHLHAASPQRASITLRSPQHQFFPEKKGAVPPLATKLAGSLHTSGAGAAAKHAFHASCHHTLSTLPTLLSRAQYRLLQEGCNCWYRHDLGSPDLTEPQPQADGRVRLTPGTGHNVR